MKLYSAHGRRPFLCATFRLGTVVSGQDGQEVAPVGHRDCGTVELGREEVWRSRLRGARVDLVATRSVYRNDVEVVS